MHAHPAGRHDLRDRLGDLLRRGPGQGDEWAVEPSPSRVLSVLAGGDIEGDDDADDAEAEAEAAARAFLGEAAYDQLLELDAAGAE